MGISQREPTPVVFVAAAGGPAGSGTAFSTLESRFETLRGRKFFGTFHEGEYRACAVVLPDDDVTALGLPTWTIPGGAYCKRVWKGGWDCIGKTFDEMAREHEHDRSRPTIEFYKRENEVVLFLPVK